MNGKRGSMETYQYWWLTFTAAHGALDIKLVSIEVGKMRNWAECYIIQACLILGFSWLPWAKPLLIGCVVNYNCIVFVWFNSVIIHLPTLFQTYTLNLHAVLFNSYNGLNIKLSYFNCFKMSSFCVTQKKTTILRWTFSISYIELSGRQTLFGSIDECYFENHTIGTVIKLAER